MPRRAVGRPGRRRRPGHRARTADSARQRPSGVGKMWGGARCLHSPEGRDVPGDQTRGSPAAARAAQSGWRPSECRRSRDRRVCRWPGQRVLRQRVAESAGSQPIWPRGTPTESRWPPDVRAHGRRRNFRTAKHSLSPRFCRISESRPMASCISSACRHLCCALSRRAEASPKSPGTRAWPRCARGGRPALRSLTKTARNGSARPVRLDTCGASSGRRGTGFTNWNRPAFGSGHPGIERGAGFARGRGSPLFE